MKDNSKSKVYKKPLWFVWLPIVAVLLAIAIVADTVCSVYWSVLSIAFADTESVTNQELLEEAFANSKDVSIRIQEEGSVLLKNGEGENTVLPLPASSKVNVYGIISANFYPNCDGSGSVTSSGSVSLKTALEEEGIEVNKSLWDLLASREVKTTSNNTNSTTTELVTEISLSDYNSAMSWSAAKNYSEYAIVTFGRLGGENTTFRSTDLELGASELALLKQLHDTGFKVITLINSSSVIELGPVEEYSDAVLWIGGPGQYGMYGVARILSGSVSPSGRLVDTWMYEHETNSTYYTTQQYNYVDASKNTLGGFSNFKEGIYVGYRWYETADAEGYWNGAPYNGYENVVAYPFGYGLSYGDLSEEIVSAEKTDSGITFTVKATNANGAASKNVFELYVQKPYVNGQHVEVSKVELVGFAKSEAITNADADGYTTTITVPLDDLYSYDSSANGGKGAYVLAAGEYKFYLASGETGAHCWSVYGGENDDSSNGAVASNGHVYTVNLTEQIGRSSDLAEVQNQLGASENHVFASDDGNAGYKALSRANGFANAKQTIFTADKNVVLSTSDPMYKALTDYSDYGTYRGEILENLAVEQNNGLTFEDMYTYDSEGNLLYDAVYDEETGALVSKTVTGSIDWDDPRWDDLIAQMSISEMESLIGYAGWRTSPVASIGKSLVIDVDGPVGLTNYLGSRVNSQQVTTSFNSEPVLAATWNVDLVNELGVSIGKEANAKGYSGWYAPGANLHRTPFGGRAAEYFSEDAFISGKMCSAESGGALSVGLYCYAKHFALNDIEVNRTGMENCWVSEQAVREIYFKPFEMAIKDGNLTAIMTSYMWVNGEWLGSNYNIITNIVREEWGFNGIIQTDNGTNCAWMTPSKLLYAGGDMILVSNLKRIDNGIKNSDEGISAMKTATKRILYNIASSYLYRTQVVQTGANKFVPIFIAANIVLYGAAAVCAAVYVTKLVLYKKKGGNAEA